MMLNKVMMRFANVRLAYWIKMTLTSLIKQHLLIPEITRPNVTSNRRNLDHAYSFCLHVT